MDWKEISTNFLIKDNKIRRVTIDKFSFSLVYLEDSFHAFSLKCPHAGAPLSDGFCDNTDVVCPYHRRKYNIYTGKGVKGQGDFITIYALKEEDGKIYINRPKSFWAKIF